MPIHRVCASGRKRGEGASPARTIQPGELLAGHWLQANAVCGRADTEIRSSSKVTMFALKLALV